jgi:serine/threonine protein kinase/WD40 repeat protein
MNGDDDRLEELLDRWEAARAEGVLLSAQQLAGDDLELSRSLQSKLTLLQRFDQFDVDDHHPAVSNFPIGSYLVQEQIAHGATSIVYAARKIDTGERVAIKVLDPSRMHRAGESRFEREISILRHLNDPHIAPILDAGVVQHHGIAQRYLVMPLIQGEPLDRFVFSRDLPLRQRVELLALIARTVAVAHKAGIVHRDLKPANVLVTSDGHPWLLDFGLASVRGHDSLVDGNSFQTSWAVLGTLAFMSPEQSLGSSHESDGRADVYSLSVMAYYLLAGRLPIEVHDCTTGEAHRRVETAIPRSLRRVTSRVSRTLSEIIDIGLAKHPRHRYQSMEAFAEDLRRYLDGRPPLRRPLSPLRKAWRILLAYPRATATAAAFALLLILATVISLSLAHNANEARRMTESALDDAMYQRGVAEEHERQSRRIAYDLRIAHAYAIAETRPEFTVKLLDDPQHCPPELRDAAWGLARAFASSVYVDLPVSRPIRLMYAATAPSDDALLLVDANGRIMIWDLERHHQRAIYQSDVIDSPIVHASMQNDFKRLAVAHRNGEIRFFEEGIGLRSDLSRRLDDCPLAIKFNWNHDLIVVTADLVCEYWHASYFSVIKRHPLDASKTISSINMDQVANRVGISYTDGELEIWNSQTEECEKYAFLAATDLAFVNGAPRLFACSNRAITFLRTIAEPVHGSIHFGHEKMLFVATDAHHVAAFASSRRVDIHDDSQKLHGRSYELPTTPRSIALSKASDYLCVLLSNGVVRVYKTNPPRYRAVVRGHIGTQLAEIPRTSRFAVGFADGAVAIWDAVTNEIVEERRAVAAPVSHIFLMPDGQTLGVIDCEGGRALLDMLGNGVAALPDADAPPHCPTSFACDNSKHTLQYATHDGRVYLWNLVNHDVELVTEFVHAQDVCLGLHDAHAAVLGHDGSLVLYQGDLKHKRAVRQLDAGPDRIDKLLASSHGNRLVAQTDRGFRVWSVPDGKLLASRSEDYAPIARFSFSPDGRNLIMMEHGGGLSIGDAESGAEQIRLTKSPIAYTNAIVSEYGRWLVAVTLDGRIVSWPMAPYIRSEGERIRTGLY